MTVYDGGGPPRRPRRRRRRRWVRIALWTGGSLAAVAIAVVAVGFFLFYHDYNQLTTPPPSFRRAETKIDTLPEANAPAIALVIGSDHRYTDGAAPARSDTLMLVRLDPRTHLISLLSLPRDLWVPIPGFGDDKINAAYSDGGPKLTLETVKEVTGLHVNYLIGVNFHSFISLVNNLGGVYIPVDEAYIHTQAANQALPPGERWSVINILPGYQLLNGANALAFSRFRHTDSDFYRNARQQTFLHAFEQKVSDRFHGISLTDLGTIKAIIDTISGNVDIAGAHGGIGIQTMIKYATLAYASRGHLVSSRLQAGTGMIGAASVVETTPEAMTQAVYAFTHPQNIPSPMNQLPTNPTHTKTKRGFTPAVAPATVSLSILNGTLKTGEAAATAQKLGKFGYQTSSGNAPTQTHKQTWVYYGPGHARAATDVAHIIGHGAATGPMPATIASAQDVVVVLGTDFAGRLAVTAPRTASRNSALPPDITPDSQAYLTEFRAMTPKVTFPVMYPTVSQDSSEVPDTYPIRAYHIPNAGHHWSSLYAYFQMPNIAGADWGIEETRFTDAPILSDPSAVRKVGRRTYRFSFDGSKIHMVAFLQDGTAYWVQNTLLDDLSNADMIAIARSLEPVA
jgi:LCP family protein required for cell wall assembly